MADIVLVNPRFTASYWGLEYALPLLGKRANLPVACLPLLAALTPPEHQVTLVDENVEEIDFDRLARADIVGLTGMSVQRQRMLEICEELRRRGVFVVIGGPWVTVQEDYFDGLADVIFIGEAEETWPQFLEEWKQGEHRRRYEQADKTDMTRVPVPRFDLLKMRHYLFGSLQFSRGCPYQCEFCDIIVTFGRRPRLKTEEQIERELDALHAQGISIAFIVDDNLIGNKKGVKPLLRRLVDWQQRHAYQLTFFTEASLDLAEDEELLQLMGDANIQCVFVGIESPNEESLRETKKYQNVRSAAGSLLDRVHRIQDAGIEVWCGMIVGFDHDDTSVFPLQTEFIRRSRIGQAMVGMLTAIPKTPLYERLKEDGRLDPADHPEYGTNVIPLQMSRDELRDGYVQVMQDLYAPEAYFERLEGLYLRDGFKYAVHQLPYWRKHRVWWLRHQTTNLAIAAYLYWRLMRCVREPELRSEYRRRFHRLLRVRREPALLFIYLMKMAVHYHYHKIVEEMVRQKTERRAPVLNTF